MTPPNVAAVWHERTVVGQPQEADTAEYQILLDENRRLIRVTVHGAVNRGVGEEIISNARKAAADRGFAILYDARDARVEVPFSRWYLLPRTLGVFFRSRTRNVKVAILIPSEQLEEYRFYETVSSNLGLPIRVFRAEGDALAWLA